MVDQTSLRNCMAELEAEMNRVMEFLWQSPDPLPMVLFLQVATLQMQVPSLQRSMSDLPGFVEGNVNSVTEDVSILKDAVNIKFEGGKMELSMQKCALGREKESACSSKVKVPDPRPFGSARSAKELENFLWYIKTYFQAARIPDVEKVSITSMYLMGNAKLWWRTHLFNNASTNCEKIETWDVLKKEMRD